MNQSIKKVLPLPVCVLVGILCAQLLHLINAPDGLSSALLILTVSIGAAKFFWNTIRSLMRFQFGLDYIAIAAILTAVGTENYLVAAVIVLMLTSGEALEEYAGLRAQSSLTALVDRIPRKVTVLNAHHDSEQKNIEDVRVGDEIMVRRGEVIPLDGVLATAVGLADESSLTGEPYFIEKQAADIVRSGTVNVGNVMHITVTAEDKDSTYRKIIELVQEARQSQAPLVRLADRYSTIFTLITAAITLVTYAVSRDIELVLAVLVVATPCPLLLATPIALIGGMSAAASQKIILKNLASIETLSRVNALVFDKTGTITLGQPTITRITSFDSGYTEGRVLSLAQALERNSLHPLAKAIVQRAQLDRVPVLRATHVEEQIGKGISGHIDGRVYSISTFTETDHLVVAVACDGVDIAHIEFADEVKVDSVNSLRVLEKSGFAMYMLTGDKQAVADAVAKHIGIDIHVEGQCTPERKLEYMKGLRAEGKVSAMIGDGINDAPALAAADVGIVFSNEQHTAASEAADIVLLGGNFSSVISIITIAQRTIRIALQSIWVGIGLSMCAMIAAAFGYIPPLVGSFLQEGIDVLVILNALRSSYYSRAHI